jgi:hypothetical protein
LRNLSLKYKIIHDALKAISNKTLKCPREYGNIEFFDDMGTGMILAKNREIA